jgi:hypothetical protein
MRDSRSTSRSFRSKPLHVAFQLADGLNLASESKPRDYARTAVVLGLSIVDQPQVCGEGAVKMAPLLLPRPSWAEGRKGWGEGFCRPGWHPADVTSHGSSKCVLVNSVGDRRILSCPVWLIVGERTTAASSPQTCFLCPLKPFVHGCRLQFEYLTQKGRHELGKCLVRPDSSCLRGHFDLSK